MSGMRTSEGERTALLIRLSQVQLRTVGTIQALQETKPQIRRHPQQKQNDSPTRKLHTSHTKIRPRAEQHAHQAKRHQIFKTQRNINATLTPSRHGANSASTSSTLGVTQSRSYSGRGGYKGKGRELLLEEAQQHTHRYTK